MENMVISIDGKTVSCRAGTSILEAADQLGIRIPRLCHHPDLKPFGACRLCLVEDEKTGRLMAACVTPVAPHLAVQTHSPRVVNHRRNIIRLMIAEHPESCIVCSKGNRCGLRQVAAQYGVGETHLYPMANARPLEQANPFITRDLSKCILCGKCIRADHELVAVGAIDYNHRGFRSRPATVHEADLGASECTFCGTCVSICPTGALALKGGAYVGTPVVESDSVCGFCGVGCRLAMGAAYEKITEVNPAGGPDSVNGATLCVRGHFAHDFLNTPKRLHGPLIRTPHPDTGESDLAPASWEAALCRVSDRFRRIIAQSGPQSIGFLGSSKCTLEENYLFQKLARVTVQTNHIDNGGFVSGQRLVMHLDEKTGGRWRRNPLSWLDSAESILVIGADPNHSVPVVSYYLKRAAQRGVPLIVVDPRRTELVKWATAWLRINPRSDLELLNGLAACLLERNGYDAAFIDKHTEGFGLYRYGLSSLNRDRVCRMTGLEKSRIERAADLLHGKKISVVVGHGILQQQYGAHSLGALINLSLLSGGFGVRPAGFYVLIRENNAMGAMDMGAVPNLLPGRRSLTHEAVRKSWEKAWKTTLSPDPGLDMVRMIEAAEKGFLKALYIMGENPVRSLPESDRVKKALQKLEFLVVQDIVQNETTAIADVVLSGAAFSEKGGAFTNLEGRIQSFSPVVSPPGLARADWWILDSLGGKMGNAAPYGSVDKIDEEIRRLVPMYAQLDGRAQGWIGAEQPNGAHPISFSAVVSTEEAPVAEDFPVTAIIGSQRYHLGSGTRTGLSPRIRAVDVQARAEISPQDAEALNVSDAGRVRIVSHCGELTRDVRVNGDLSPGQVFVPTGVENNSALALIGLDALSGARPAGWKTCPVRLEKVD